MSLLRHFRDIFPYRLHQSLIPNVLPGSALPPASMAEAEVVAGLANVTGREVGCGIKRQQPPALPTTTTRPKENRVG